MRKWVLVTGASSGIGAELARVYARRRHNLILVARRKQRLDALARELRGEGAQVRVLPMDLSRQNAAGELFDRVGALDLHVDVLVNNAGVSYSGPFVAMDPSLVDNMLQLDVATLAKLTRLFAAPMVAAGGGSILNVASTTSFLPVPGMSLYAAGKAFILSFSEALSEELKGSGVSVTALCPGPTDTEMVDLTRGIAETADRIPSLVLASAREVAEQGFAAAERGEVICIPGVTNRVTALFMQSQPRWLVRRLGGLFGRKFLLKQ